MENKYLLNLEDELLKFHSLMKIDIITNIFYVTYTKKHKSHLVKVINIYWVKVLMITVEEDHKEMQTKLRAAISFK